MKARTVLAAATAAAALGVSAAQAASCEGEARPGTAQMRVEVADVTPIRGQVVITVYPNDKKRFLAPGAKLLRARLKAEPGVTRACFNLAPGYYAIAIYHDANSNKDFDRKLTGLPAEGFGFSNDAPSRIGLPPFEAVRFRFDPGDAPVRISMRYL